MQRQENEAFVTNFDAFVVKDQFLEVFDIEIQIDAKYWIKWIENISGKLTFSRIISCFKIDKAKYSNISKHSLKGRVIE